jgi:tRNA-binding EMAP/Myf-like protein
VLSFRLRKQTRALKMPPKKGKRKDDFDFDNPEAELSMLSMAEPPAREPSAPKQGKSKGGEKHVEIEAPSMMDAAVDDDDAAASGAAKKGKDKKKKNKGKEDFDFDNPPSIEDIAAAAAEAQASRPVSTPKAKSGFAALMGDDEEEDAEEDADEQQAKQAKEMEKAAAKERARQEKEAEKARQEEEKQRQKEAKEREKEAKKAAAALELAARVIPDHLKAEIPAADLKKAVQKIGFTFKKIVVAKVVSVSPHPKADNMCVVTVNNGRNDLVVVCSDTTVQPGQLVPFAPVGSEIEDPETQMSTDITARKMRGIESFGMLCRCVCFFCN